MAFCIDIVAGLGENGGGFRETPGHATMTLRTAVKYLLVLSLALPLVAGVLVWVGGLLRAMGDAAGATAVGYIGTACQVVWLVCLVGLLVTLAMTVLGERPADGEGE
jgi:Na+-driven multidrug efflux pump